MSTKEKKAALNAVGKYEGLQSVIEDIDKESKIPFQAIASRFYHRLTEPEREKASKLFVCEAKAEGAVLKQTEESTTTAGEAKTKVAGSAQEVLASRGDGTSVEVSGKISPTNKKKKESIEDAESAALRVEKQLRERRIGFAEIALPTLRAHLIQEMIVGLIRDKFPNIDASILPIMLSNIVTIPDSEGKMVAPLTILDGVHYRSGEITGKMFHQPTDSGENTIMKGYFRPAAANMYQFHLPKESAGEGGKEGVKIEFMINGVKLYLEQSEFSEQWTTAPIMMSNGQDYLLNSSINLRSISWATKQSAPVKFTSTTLIPYDSAVTVTFVLRSVDRIACILNKLRLSLEELKYFQVVPSKTSRPESLHMMTFDFNSLSLSDLETLQSYQDMRDTVAKDPHALIRLFSWLSNSAPLDTTELAAQLAAATSWPKDQLHYALQAKCHSMKPDAIIQLLCDDFKELVSLQEIVEVFRRVNAVPGVKLSMTTLFQLALLGPTTTDFRNATSLRLSLPERQLSHCAAELRERQRTALVQYLLQQDYIKEKDIYDADGLFDYFLIDVQMGPQMELTRMKQAISTVQLYVQRCLLGLEVKNGVQSKHINRDK